MKPKLHRESVDIRVSPKPVYDLIKRLLDFVVGLLLAISLLPLFLVCALAVKLDSPGPVFYAQMRVGRGNKLFPFLKFRTMKIHVDPGSHREFLEKLANRQSADYRAFPLEREDIRVTKVGKILRRFSLDELPRLFNVIAGHVSLVGPRPLMPRDAQYLLELFPARHEVPPGITGLWQISARQSHSLEELTLLDRYYIEHRSLSLDLQILLATIPVILFDISWHLDRKSTK